MAFLQATANRTAAAAGRRAAPAPLAPSHAPHAAAAPRASVPQAGRAEAVAAAPAPAARTGRAMLCRAAAAEVETPAAGDAVSRNDVRNIAIIAHVDHGKTTLVDSLLAQSNIFRSNQKQEERIMDSDALERERGITILAKNTAVTYKDTKINIIDTPGHADFGGEVERVLNMCDGVLLLVDSVEGPMPQTRFVLRKALKLNKKVVVVVNKIDRDAARPDWVVDQVFELMMDLGASDEQIDFPVVYASGFRGIAGHKPDELADTLQPLFETVVRDVPAPLVRPDSPLQMMSANIDFDKHLGRIAIGRVVSGTIRKGQAVSVVSSLTPDQVRTAKVSELYVYSNFAKVPVEEVQAGDIAAMTGISDIAIGETICDRDTPMPLETIEVENPTVSMVFKVNTSPFAGKEGKFVTSRNIKERLDRELEKNLALRVEPGETADAFVVSGRGALHLGILIENMRREGYEFEISPPQVITKLDESGSKTEPYELASVEVPDANVGACVELFAARKGEMVDMAPFIEGTTRLKFRIATRGLLGMRNALLTATRGLAVMNSNFQEFGPLAGEIVMRDSGSLVAFESGQVTAYSLETAQARGTMFCRPGDQVYEGQIVGIHAKAGDLKINVCKAKALTNMRAAGKDKSAGLDEPRVMSLDDCLEYIATDELVEVTPESVRMRKDPMAGAKGGKGKR